MMMMVMMMMMKHLPNTWTCNNVVTDTVKGG